MKIPDIIFIIKEGKSADISKPPLPCTAYTGMAPEHNTCYLFKICGFLCAAITVIAKQFPESLLPFANHNSGKKRQLFQDFLRIIGYLRPSQPNRDIGKNFCQFPDDIPDYFPVPYITGKRDTVWFPSVNIRQDILEGLIYGIFCKFNIFSSSESF